MTAVAVQPSVVRRGARDAVGELLAETPQVRVNIMREMAMHMTAALTRVRELTTARVDQRLAHTVLRLADQCGRPEPDGVLIAQPLTRQEIADLTGTTLYTVSRTLAKWESLGVVETRKRMLLVRSMQQLEDIAGADESSRPLSGRADAGRQPRRGRTCAAIQPVSSSASHRPPCPSHQRDERASAPMLAGAVCSSPKSTVTRSADSGFSMMRQHPGVLPRLRPRARPTTASSSEVGAEQQQEPQPERDEQAADVVAHPEADRHSQQRQGQADAGGRRGDDHQRAPSARRSAPSARPAAPRPARAAPRGPRSCQPASRSG